MVSNARPKIVAAFDQHDYDQLLLLAGMNRIKLSELVRRICKAHLDGTKAKLKQEA